MPKLIDVTDKRVMAGHRLAGAGAVKQHGKHDWTVKSTSGKTYNVQRHVNAEEEEMWECECPDHAHRLVECKHIHAVQFFDEATHAYRRRVERVGKAVADMELKIKIVASEGYEQHITVRHEW